MQLGLYQTYQIKITPLVGIPFFQCSKNQCIPAFILDHSDIYFFKPHEEEVTVKIKRPSGNDLSVCLTLSLGFSILYDSRVGWYVVLGLASNETTAPKIISPILLSELAEALKPAKTIFYLVAKKAR